MHHRGGRAQGAAGQLGDESALALTSTGRVLSWGSNLAGELGTGTGAERHVPGYVKLPKHTKIISIAAGKEFSMALTTSHRILTWGYNGAGQLGNGSNTDSAIPVRAQLPARFTPKAIGAGWDTGTALVIGHQIPD
jgi:alpha-tubulin suppressor-like RCC1 family protein